MFFFPPPGPLLEAPLDGTVSLEGGVGSVGALPKLPLIVRALLATTTLTILCTAQSQAMISSDLRLPLAALAVDNASCSCEIGLGYVYKLTVTGDMVGGG